jgi:KDO2-lipid IV(A) lauroyltransferase
VTNGAKRRGTLWPTPEHLYLASVAAVIEAANRLGSPRLVDALARGLGGLAYRVSGAKRRAMERNLTRAFGALAPSERDRIVRGAFHTFWDETMAFVPWRADATPVETIGLEHLEAALAAGKGAVLWESALFGRRNLPKQVLRRHGFRIHQVHDRLHRAGFAADPNAPRDARAPAFAYFEAREREFTAGIIEMAHPETLAATRKILATLARNGIVCITADVAYGHRLLRFPLLGEPKAFPTGMVTVARTAGAALLPLFCVRERDGGYRVVIEPALPPPDPSDREGGDTLRRYAAILDGYLRRHPDQYRSWHFPWWNAAASGGSAPRSDERAATGGWRALAWRGYERLPRHADLPLRVATTALLPWTNRRVPLTELRGRAPSGDDATVLFAGSPAAAAYLAHRFFADEPVATPIATVASRHVGAELARRRAGVDLAVARIDRVTAAFALDDSWVLVPEWVGARSPVPEDVVALCRRSKSLENNLARMRRAGFRPAVSHAMEDFDLLYERMYLPSTRGRHDTEAVFTDRARLRRCFRQGGIMWALRGDERVAGLLFRVRGRTFDLIVLGTTDGARGPVADGAIFALDLFLFEHARTLGCTVLDFGGSRPSPRDGLLAYKARWDARIGASRATFYDLGLWWPRWTPALRGFLERTPLLVRQGDGLAALWYGASRADLHAAHHVLRSCRRVYLVDGAEDAARAEIEPAIVRVDTTATPGWRPSRVMPPAR